ncbi:MAG TPA: NADPH-dependent FMN reductase [Polyangia bacterium]|jgi:NAD(P)H-dependent FMN reductase
MKIAALSGSLRKGSSNAGILRAFAAIAPAGVEVTLVEGLDELPLFNPDLDGEGAVPPPPVKRFRDALFPVDAFVISSPEYAHGVPGAFKNALDWIVSSGELCGKPIVLINASPGGGEYVRRALLDTLTVMDANVLVEASLHTPFVRTILDADGNVVDPSILGQLRASLEALRTAVAARQARTD